MATPSAIAKRTERRQIEILEAIKVLVGEVAGLKEQMTPATSHKFGQNTDVDSAAEEDITVTSSPKSRRRSKK